MERGRARMDAAPGGAPDFAEAAVGKFYLSYTRTAANENLISVALEGTVLPYGAEGRPHLIWTFFKWCVKLNRDLSPEDVFKPESGWEKFLAVRLYDKLRRESAEQIYDDEALVRQSVTNSVGDEDGWLLDARKFGMRFRDHTVGIGIVSVELDWKELIPYLAAGFNPAALPQPVERPDQ